MRRSQGPKRAADPAFQRHRAYLALMQDDPHYLARQRKGGPVGPKIKLDRRKLASPSYVKALLADEEVVRAIQPDPYGF